MTRCPTTSDTSEDFETEVRAMLTRRAADVSPSPAARHRAGDQADAGEDTTVVTETTVDTDTTGGELRGGEPAVLDPAPSPLVIPLSRSRATRRSARHRAVLTAAAALVVVVGLVGLVTSARDDDTLVTGAPTTAPGQAIIWPLTYDVPAELLATPDSAARAYLSQVAQLPADLPLGVTTTDGTSATVEYVLQDIPARVSLRLVDGGWQVTGATNDAIGIVGATLDGETVGVGVSAGSRGWPEAALRGTVIDADGGAIESTRTRIVAPADGSDVELDKDTMAGSDQVVVAPPGKPAEDLAISFEVSGATGAAPHAVRLDVMSDHDGDRATPDVVVAHASSPITLPGDDSDDSDDTAAAPDPVETPAEGGAAADAPRPTPDPLPTPTDELDGTGVLATFVGRGDAVASADAFLDDRLPDRPSDLELDGEAVTTEAIPGSAAGVVVVPWHISGDSDIGGRYSGVVRLLPADGGWAVVGASTDQIEVRDIQRNGESVTFTIDRLDDGAIDSIELALFDLEGREVGESQTAPLGLPGDYRVDLDAGAPPDVAMTLRARHVGGTWFSLTEMRVPPGPPESARG